MTLERRLAMARERLLDLGPELSLEHDRTVDEIVRLQRAIANGWAPRPQRERCSTCRHWGTPDAAGAAVCALDGLELPRTAESSCTLWEARCEVIGAGVVVTGNVIRSRGDS